MKNIILVTQDRNDFTEEERLNIINAIVKSGDYRIVLLVINGSGDKEKYRNIEGVQEVITSMELEYEESMEGLSYKDIARFKEAELYITNGARRLHNDYPMEKYYFYSAYCYWKRFFDKHQIDFVVQTKPYHGFAYDLCDNIAKERGIGFFHIIPIGYNNTFGAYAGANLLPIVKSDAQNINYLLRSHYDKTKLPPSKENKGIFRKTLYSIGGNLLEDFVVRLLHMNWSSRAIIQKRAKIYWSDKLLGYLKTLSIKRYMKNLSVEPNLDEKYVCYFLHVEPEAPQYISAVLENQLTIIKILSETLPKGYTLYVKEHPAQFDLNKDAGYYHMFDAPLYKTKKFYQKIASLPNVKLVNIDIKSEDLIEKAQAVSSISGTALLESVAKEKPIIAFSSLTPMAYLKDSFVINSFDDCKKAMKKLAAGFKPKYSDADEVIRKYVFKGEDIAENILGLLRK